MLIKSAGEIGIQLEAIVGREGNRASPERDVAVDYNVGRAGCGELGLSSGVHVGSAAEAVGEKEYIGVPPGCGW